MNTLGYTKTTLLKGISRDFIYLGGFDIEHSKCLRSMNLLRGSYHCIRNTPPGRAPHRYLNNGKLLNQ